IFDAGTTPGGYPYFVMEFVPGKDIKTHCDDAKLSIRGRIRLFLQVCDGVLHAHQKGLIHRDLKPSNILVKQRSEQPALVKLIDFGIAKSLTGGLGAGLHTRIGSFVGTPVYSSPEQVTDPTRDIDTRADLYSLGVVLYEILTGVPPRSAQELDADTPAELARRLRDTKTPAMGTRYSGLSPAEQQQIAELRALSTDGLSMQLCSDLDWIVGKCIALDPDDRYATVQDLRLDLQRWLDDRPIEARPTNAWYRLRKMVRRNRLNTALIAGATLGLIGTSAAAVIAYQQADEARRNAESAAAFQSAQMKSVDLTFLGEQLRKDMENAARASGKADPEAFLSGIDFMDLSLRQLNASLLEPALSAAEVQFKDNPEVHSQLLHSLAEVSYQLGDYQKAERAATKALQLRQLEFGEDDRRTLESAASLAAIKWQEDEVEEAEALIRNATTRMRATLGSDDPLLASSLNRLARILVAAGKLDEARELLKANSKKFETIFSAHNIHAMEALNQYGNVLADQSQLVEARAALTTLLERRRGALGDTHRDTLNTMNDLGLVLRDQGEIAAASEYLKSALEGYRRIAGEFHPDTVQIAGNYSGLLFRAGKLREAEELAWQVMKARDRTFGEYHSNSLPTAMNLGRFLNEQGRAAEAEALIRAFVKRHEKSPLLPHLELRLVTALRLQGKLDAAEDLARQIMSGAESAPQGYIPWLATDELGLIMAANGRFKEAESLHREAYSRLREMFGETDTSTLASVANLVRALIAQEKIAEARAVGEFLVANARKIYPEGHYLHGVYLTLDALMLSASNRFEEAEARFEEAWKLLDATPELDPEHKRFLATAVSKLDERWKMLQPGPTTPRPWRTQLENAGSMQSG
ncbi:MAG: serine/threonine-protein kinase, partial [Xanthomonadales bacterium]|nr:serine/threonine-protein kinase [Xanthomonadales bacterium]